MFHLGVGDVLVYHDAIQDTGLLKGSSRDLWVREGVVTVVGAVVECREREKLFLLLWYNPYVW